MTKRFIPVLAACLFLMVGTAQAATSLAFPPPDTKGGKPLMQTLVLRSDGAWLYDAPKHSLEQVSSSDLRNFLAGQGFVREAPVGLVYVTDTQKNSKELFAAMHTGSAYQNVGLFCASVGLHNVVRASYDAEGLASALGLPNSKHILISQSIGWGE